MGFRPKPSFRGYLEHGRVAGQGHGSPGTEHLPSSPGTTLIEALPYAMHTQRPSVLTPTL